MIDHPARVNNVEDCDWEYIEGEEDRKDAIRWKTLLGNGGINAKGINMGVFEVPVGAQLEVHHHAPQEVYHFYQDSAEVLVGDDLCRVEAGHTVYNPPNVSHGIKNIGGDCLKLYWIFPTDDWHEIVYHMEGRKL